jgi:integrase
VAKLRQDSLSVASINRQLEVLRRLPKLALDRGKVEKALPKVEMLAGENHRDRVLSEEEETRYFEGATGNGIEEAYQRALDGLRAAMRSGQPIKPEDPFILRDATTLLMDCGLRPDECFRLRWEHVRDERSTYLLGRQRTSRRTIPLTLRMAALLEMRRPVTKNEWVFPAQPRAAILRNPACRSNTRKPAI